MSIQVADGCMHARNVHKRIAVYKQRWAIIILKCQRGHAVYKQGWAFVLLHEKVEASMFVAW
jgi:hypothetical protein